MQEKRTFVLKRNSRKPLPGIGRFYAEEKTLFQQFGRSESEGIKLLVYQLKKASREWGIFTALRIMCQGAVKYAACKKADRMLRDIRI